MSNKLVRLFEVLAHVCWLPTRPGVGLVFKQYMKRRPEHLPPVFKICPNKKAGANHAYLPAENHLGKYFQKRSKSRF